MSNQKGYYIINKIDGTPVAKLELESGAKMPRINAMVSNLNPLSKDDSLPLMAVYKDRCLVMTNPNRKA